MSTLTGLFLLAGLCLMIGLCLVAGLCLVTGGLARAGTAVLTETRN